MNVIRKILSIKSLYQHFGPRWFLFRIGYAIRMKTGLIRNHIPAYQWQEKPLTDWVKMGVPTDAEEYFQWRQELQPNFLFDQIPEIPKKAKWNRESVLKEADQYLAGISRYFSKTDFQVGFPPDWHLDPFLNIHLPHNKHWSQIPDDGDFDIKFVWEANRFSQIFTLVRAYAHKPDDHYPAAFWKLIEDWMEKNPPNFGPNWKDGQEAALRILAISFGYYAFRHHPESTPDRITKLTMLVAALAERICKNIDYAIFTRSNHTISEGFGLWLTGTLFPELRNAEKYQINGKKILEKEASHQIYPDGGYSMHSLNYHRFVLHIYIFALRIAELNNTSFSANVYQAIERSIEFLYHLMDTKTGKLPQYGSNDGALILPLNSCEYGDYRPLLQAGYYLLHKKQLFSTGPWDEDLFWLFGIQAFEKSKEMKTQLSDYVFWDSGISKISGKDSYLFVRCNNFHDRPSHADQLHVDLLWQGKNVALDAGTYLYNGQEPWQNGLAKTNVHNTITVDNQDQMQKFSRFIWVDWSKGVVLRHGEKNGIKYWQGQHSGYHRLSDPVDHKRTIILLDGKGWLIVDHVCGNKPHDFTLNWLLDKGFSAVDEGNNVLKFDHLSKTIKTHFGGINTTSEFSVVSADPNSTRGWVSNYYGHKEPALSVQLHAKNTQMIFWTFYGDESFEVESSIDVLSIQKKQISLRMAKNLISITKPDINQALEINPLVEKTNP